MALDAVDIDDARRVQLVDHIVQRGLAILDRTAAQVMTVEVREVDAKNASRAGCSR